MSQFYNRYIPPRKHEHGPIAVESQGSVDDNNSHNHNEPPKRSKKRKASDKLDRKTIDPSSNAKVKHSEPNNDVLTGESVLSKYSVSYFAKSHGEHGVVKPQIRSQVKQSIPGEEGTEKHATVLHRYKTSRTWSKSTEGRDNGGNTLEEPSTSEAQLHGLVPIPQPEDPEVVTRDPTYSVLPSWQTTPVRVAPSTNEPLTRLGLSDIMVTNLRAEGIEKAFPVQSTVIPLLMAGSHHYDGDICISAATGSGKTLAYIVPVVDSLGRDRSSGLRAIIVVPTRELVAQVRQTCQMCAAGLGLKIATTLGSKSLKDEEKALIIEEEVYDPEEYKKELETPMDWADLSLESILQRARHRDPAKAFNHVTRRRIIPDILITTPGRLVDHLQNTVGFHLDNVRWLVIDEADRLLNESYQEWIDTVVPALRSRRATQEQDQILSHMRMKLPPRVVRKVLLSATMTRDISKLNQIGLNNPKLVVLNSSQEDRHSLALGSNHDAQNLDIDAADKYLLPTSLQEFAITFKEGSEKPLLLLQILREHIKVLHTSANEARSAVPQNFSASSDSEESDSGSDTDKDSIESDSEMSLDSSSGSSVGVADNARSDQPSVPLRGTENSTAADSITRILIFTRSTASASRLSRLLCIVSPNLAPRIATLTRTTASSSASRKALASFRTGKTPVLIATDRASRGIDVAGLQHVISYDIPGSVSTYIHRVGRTARAGRMGSAWTMVEHREGKWFWNEIGGKGKDCLIQRSTKVKRVSIVIGDDNELRERYEDALQVLGAEVKGH